MAKSLRTVCYVPLIVFALGWILAQFLYLKQRNQIKAGTKNVLRTHILCCNSNILLAGSGETALLFAGIYLGVYGRWFLLGISIVIILVQIVRTGAALEFAAVKLNQSQYDRFRLVTFPYTICLACSLITEAWIVYVFWIAGL